MIIKEQTFVPQRFDWDCGVACYLMALSNLGFQTPSFDSAVALLECSAEEGTTTIKLESALLELTKRSDSIKFRSGEDGTASLLSELVTGLWTTIVCFREPIDGNGHFAIVQSVSQEFIVLADPEHGIARQIEIQNFDWCTGFEKPERKRWYLALRNLND